MMRFVLDTNIISFLIDHDARVQTRMTERVSAEDVILGCPMVWYEVLRGLRAKDARRKLAFFRQFYATFEWQNYTHQDWDLAASLWANRRTNGRPIGDGDLLIAVFAINRNAILVTDNTRDFSGLDVSLENWRSSM